MLPKMEFAIGDVVEVDRKRAQIRGLRLASSGFGGEGWEYYLKESAPMRPDKDGATYGTITRYYWKHESELTEVEYGSERS